MNTAKRLTMMFINISTLHRIQNFILAFLFVMASPGTATTQNLPARTTWEGKLGAIRIILKINEDSTMKLRSAVFDSPDQGAFSLKVSSLKISVDSISAYSAAIGGGFYGAFNPSKTELTGQWKQGGAAPLTLKRVENKPDFRRPQMPVGPFPYPEEQVIYHNADRSIQYGATLTIPKAEKLVPAVILITGSGSQDRDETIFGHKPFWVLADYLSRNGIAVLRVDDRGIGQTTGEVANATSADFAKDVLAGIDFLKNHKGIDPKRIGLIGHSEGGIIAPLAANQSKDVAFIVSMAGVGMSGMELWNAQSRTGFVKAGFNEDDLKHMERLFYMMFDISKKYDDMGDIGRAFEPAFAAWKKQQSAEFLTKAGMSGPDADDRVRALAARFYSPWMRYLVSYDPAPVLSKITIPVLALNGEKDIQVLAKPNLEGFKKYLTQAGNKHFKTIIFPGLNHLFQHADTGEISEYIAIEETISPEVLKVITDWIRKVSNMP
jgi:pimeloyl-ACP methyl ester carboxylesterase